MSVSKSSNDVLLKPKQNGKGAEESARSCDCHVNQLKTTKPDYCLAFLSDVGAPCISMQYSKFASSILVTGLPQGLVQYQTQILAKPGEPEKVVSS